MIDSHLKASIFQDVIDQFFVYYLAYSSMLKNPKNSNGQIVIVFDIIQSCIYWQ